MSNPPSCCVTAGAAEHYENISSVLNCGQALPLFFIWICISLSGWRGLISVDYFWSSPIQKGNRWPVLTGFLWKVNECRCDCATQITRWSAGDWSNSQTRRSKNDLCVDLSWTETDTFLFWIFWRMSSLTDTCHSRVQCLGESMVLQFEGTVQIIESVAV